MSDIKNISVIANRVLRGISLITEEVIDYDYTIVWNHGLNSELFTIEKSLGHVPDDKVDSMVNYFQGWAEGLDGEELAKLTASHGWAEGLVVGMDGSEGWYEEFSQYDDDPAGRLGGYNPPFDPVRERNFMSPLYAHIGIPVTVGVYHIAEECGIVKHLPPPRPLIDGAKNYIITPYGYHVLPFPKN